MAIVESRDCICTKEAMVWYDGWFDYAKVFSKVFIRREMDKQARWRVDAVLQHTKCVFLTECDVAGHWIRYGKH